MEAFIKNTRQRGGAKGRQWLESLPNIVNQLAHKWSLTNLKPLENLSYNYVLQAYCSDVIPVILKIGLEPSEIEQEEKALRFYQGQGCVNLLESDFDKGALLLESIKPGLTLKTLFPHHDTRAIAHSVKVMKQLHAVPVMHSFGFPTLDKHLESLFKVSQNALPKRELKKAQTLARILLCSQATPVLLHSDLHHENILFHETKGWLAIDPRGVVGEPAFEVGTFIYNPIPDLLAQNNASSIIATRLNLFAQLLEIDLQRLKDWAYVQTVLSACWDVEGNASNKYAIECANLIEGI